MKKLFTLILLTTSINAQLSSIRLTTDYTPLVGKSQVESASAFGSLVDINYSVQNNLIIGISFGYKLYSLNQNNQLELWGWDFWNNRYLNKISSDLRADPNLSVDISSIQKMDLLPFTISFKYKQILSDNFNAVVFFAGGVYFFTRRMYAVETWSKKFPVDNYVFTYSYRNFAPSKKGNPLGASVGLDVYYQLFSNIDLSGGISFCYYIPTKNKMGYDSFPIKNDLTIKLGLNFNY